MPLILSLAMIVPGAVCVACAATARPRASRTAVVGAAAMLAAMLAMATGALTVPVAWAAGLVALAVAAAIMRRIRRGRGSAGAHDAFEWHRPVGIVVMASLIAGGGESRAAGGPHSHGASAELLPIVGVLYIAAVAVWMLQRRRELAPRHLAEGASMAVMTGAMLAMGAA